ncbi:hypothetical protein HPP92_018280 [Vanilla planifolia]|uniref:Uncharacterized protein n=1 Tax=Vanilla planifolia TaxID=51239 RepID=A0A835Q5F7_VANPL|nr:hypothetical protein HPP92_018280 [Vanilla planifolia]
MPGRPPLHRPSITTGPTLKQQAHQPPTSKTSLHSHRILTSFKYSSPALRWLPPAPTANTQPPRHPSPAASTLNKALENKAFL